LGTCSVASIASSGTIFILFPSSSAGSGGRKSFGRYLKKKNKNIAASVATAVVGVVAAAPNTKVKMTCPYIPTDVTVTTVYESLNYTRSQLTYSKRQNSN
jgi:hypothetical protein